MAAVAPPHPAGHDGHVITQTHADVTRDVVGTLSAPTRGYVLLLLGAVSLFLIGIVTFLVLIKDGLGHAGYQPPIFWSVYITTFVFWVGIGHAGTLISAILFLFRSPWRTAVYRSTEAMTVFAISTYLTVSTTFLVFGLVPDVAAVRDKASGWRKKIYELVSVGWKGTDNQWRHYSRAYLYLAALE